MLRTLSREGWGRPYDLVPAPGGEALLVSDERAGAVLAVAGPAAAAPSASEAALPVCLSMLLMMSI